MRKTVKEITDQAMDLLGYTSENGNERLTRRILNKLVPTFNAVYADIWHIEITPNNLMEWYAIHDVEKFKTLKNMKPRERIIILEEESEFHPVKTLSDYVELRDRAIEAITYGVAAFIAQSEDDGDNQAVWMRIYNNKRAGLSHLYHVHDTAPKVLERYADVNLPYPD